LSGFYFEKTIYTNPSNFAKGATADFSTWLASLGDDAAMERLNGHLSMLWPLGWSKQSIPTIDERITAAKLALDAFDVIGLQSSLAEAMAVISYWLAQLPPDDLPHANRTPVRPTSTDLPSDVARRLNAILAPDRELYEYARMLISAQRLRTLRAAATSNATGDEPSCTRIVDGIACERETTAATPLSAAVGSLPGHPSASVAMEAGTREIRFQSVAVRGEISRTEYLLVGETAEFDIRLTSSISASDLTVGIAIRDDLDALIFGTNTRILGNSFALTPGAYSTVFRFPNELGIGRYYLSVSLHRGSSHLDGCFHSIERACRFEVVDRVTEYFEGRFRLHVNAQLTPIGSEGTVDATPIDASGRGRFSLLAYRNPALTDFSARLTPLVPMPSILRASDATTDLAIENTGTLDWEAFGKRPVSVSYHWNDVAGQAIAFDGLRTSLPHDIKSGERIELTCFLRAPDIPGRMRLVFTLVQEDVAWFDAMNGTSRFECDVEVT
jgi:hypothetical protein